MPGSDEDSELRLCKNKERARHTYINSEPFRESEDDGGKFFNSFISHSRLGKYVSPFCRLIYGCLWKLAAAAAAAVEEEKAAMNN